MSGVWDFNTGQPVTAPHPMFALIDQYLAAWPVERDLIPAREVRDLLLDIRLTFMVQVEGSVVELPPFPGPRALPPPTWGHLYGLPPQDDGA